jgi:hypothetical protein
MARLRLKRASEKRRGDVPAVAFVSVGVGGRHRGEPQRVRGQAAERPERGACRLDAERGGVLVVARDGAGARAPAGAGNGRDRGAVEPPVG